VENSHVNLPGPRFLRKLEMGTLCQNLHYNWLGTSTQAHWAYFKVGKCCALYSL